MVLKTRRLILDSSKSYRTENFRICLKKDKQAVGSAALMYGTSGDLTGMTETEQEIRCRIDVPDREQKQKLTVEAMREVIRYAFMDLHLKKLWTFYYDGDEDSRIAQEKCGFSYHHKTIFGKITGEIFVEHVLRLTGEEWKKMAK